MAKGVNSTLVYILGVMFMLSSLFVFEAMLTVFSRFYSDAIAKKLVHIERNNTTRIIVSKQEQANVVRSNCNLFEGSWVIDDDVIEPLYNTTTCPFIRSTFNCTKRPDRQYLKYKWQPSGCDLPKFDGSAFLRKYKGKQIMFIGDSLSLNNYDSFLCLLYVSVPGVNHHTKSTNQSVTVIFEDYRVSVTLFNSLFLVDVEVEPNIGRVLKLNSIKNGEIWKQADILIVNTWLWWTRGGPKQPWDYIEDTDGKLVKEMNRVIAFRRGLNTWTKWVEREVDLTKTKVFYQGQAGSHHHGEDWGEPGVKGCSNQTTPVVGSIYPSGLPLPAQIMKQVLKNMTNSIFLLDITILSHLRKDGHPANHNGYSGFDCTHFCLPGVPDTWNQLFYASLLKLTS
ncbi:protein trichome birefringence-like 38 [Capsicum annuum]